MRGEVPSITTFAPPAPPEAASLSLAVAPGGTCFWKSVRSTYSSKVGSHTSMSPTDPLRSNSRAITTLSASTSPAVVSMRLLTLDPWADASTRSVRGSTGVKASKASIGGVVLGTKLPFRYGLSF